jgi:restriction system protein
MVVELLVKMGYGGTLEEAGTVVGRSGDEGIDGIIREDKLGFNFIYIQAKRWDINDTIGRPEINKFVGALAGVGATKGLFITTARFSKEAVEYVSRHLAARIVLVDGMKLTNLMIEYNLGVTLVNSYNIKKVDTDYFTGDSI